MKKFLIALLVCTGAANAQFSVDNQWFIEGGVGLALPLAVQAPTADAKDALALIHAQGSLRYMINDYIGIQGGIHFDQFKNKDKQTADLKLVSLELCYNLGELLAIPATTGEKIGLLVHAGAGYGAFSSKFDNSDRVGAILFGLKPYVMINKTVSLFTDVAYKATLKQDMYFNGVPTQYPNPGKFTGSQVGITVGVNVAIDNF
jgi:hypothetical protein